MGDLVPLDSVGSWIDNTVLNAELAGILVVPIAFWGWILLRRVQLSIWQDEAAELVAFLTAQGFEVRKSALETALLARRDAVHLRWTVGPLMGPKVVGHHGARRATQAAPSTVAELEAYLAVLGAQSIRTAGDTTTSSR